MGKNNGRNLSNLMANASNYFTLRKRRTEGLEIFYTEHTIEFFYTFAMMAIQIAEVNKY